MANDHDEIERTEAPSPRWIAHARERGIWPRSAELTVACSVLAGVVTLRLFVGPMSESVLNSLSRGLQANNVARSSGGLEINLVADFGRPLLLAVLFLVVPAIAAVIASVSQVGFRFQPENLSPDFARLSVTQSLDRIFSGKAFADSLAATVKWTGLLGLSVWWIWSDVRGVEAGGRSSESFVQLAGGTLLRVGTKVAVAILVLGCIDYARAWWSHLRQMRQSRAELIAELRESEGDPVIRRRRRQRQMDLSLGMRDKTTKTGNLVLLGTGRLAVALLVTDHADATLVAKAVGAAADRLHRAARNSGVRVVRHDALTRSTFKTIHPGESLPTELRAAIHLHRPRRAHQRITQDVKV